MPSFGVVCLSVYMHAHSSFTRYTRCSVSCVKAARCLTDTPEDFFRLFLFPRFASVCFSILCVCAFVDVHGGVVFFVHSPLLL